MRGRQLIRILSSLETRSESSQQQLPLAGRLDDWKMKTMVVMVMMVMMVMVRLVMMMRMIDQIWETVLKKGEMSNMNMN